MPERGLRATTMGSKAGLLPPASWEARGVLAVALSAAESARVERELRTPAANRLSAAVTRDLNESGSGVLVAVTLCVICDRQDDKVCRSVVLLVAVDVVDVLVASQSSAQHFRHDVTVLQNVSPAHSDTDVAVASDETPAAPVGVVLAGAASCRVAARAGAIAVLASGESARVCAELGPASLALGLHASSSRSRCEPITDSIPHAVTGFTPQTTGS